MTKCFLFDFSKYILIPILTEWLRGKDLLYLDYSQCCAEDRNYLLELMKLHPKPFEKSVFTGITISRHSHPLLIWAEVRGLTLRHLVMEMNELTLKDFKTKTKYKFHSLKKKFVCMKQILSLKIVIKLCVETSKMASRLLQCFPNLEWIEVPDVRYFKAISKYCPSIQQLHVKEGYCDFSDVSLFRNCKNISKFVGPTGYTDVLQFLPCNFILSMTVHGCDLSSVRNIRGLNTCKVLLNGMLYGYKHLTDIDVGTPTDLDLRVLLWYRGATLIKLQLGLYFEVEYPSLLDLPLTCPELTDFCLSAPDELNGELLCNVIAPLTKLKVFSTQSYINNMNPFLAAVAQKEILHSLTLLYKYDNVVAFHEDCFTLPFVTDLTLTFGDKSENTIPDFSLCSQFPNLKSLTFVTDSINMEWCICSQLPNSLIALHLKYKSLNFVQRAINPLLSMLNDYSALREVSLEIKGWTSPITVKCKFDFKYVSA